MIFDKQLCMHIWYTYICIKINVYNAVRHYNGLGSYCTKLPYEVHTLRAIGHGPVLYFLIQISSYCMGIKSNLGCRLHQDMSPIIIPSWIPCLYSYCLRSWVGRTSNFIFPWQLECILLVWWHLYWYKDSTWMHSSGTKSNTK